MHRSRIYSPRNGAILCHYRSARRAVNCPATNVANYSEFAAFLLLLLVVASICLQERKGELHWVAHLPVGVWWGLKRGWKNGKCLTNGAVNAAVDKFIWMHHTTWNWKRKGKWHSKTWSERKAFYREKGFEWGQKRQQNLHLSIQWRGYWLKDRGTGVRFQAEKAIFLFSGSNPAHSWMGSCNSVAGVQQLVPGSD